MKLRGWDEVEYKPVEGDPEVIGQIWDHIYPLFGSRTHQDGFYYHFGDTTFRKLLRLIFYHRQCTHDQLKQICSNEEILEQHLAYMIKKKVVVLDSNYWKVSPQYEHINDIGTTLEWYVAEWFQLDLKTPARYGVHLKGLPTGGDLDVVAFLGEKCVMIECKSGKPESIGEEELHLFLQRVAYFKPSIALLLVDTDNKIDKLSERIRKVYAESQVIGPFSTQAGQLDKGSVNIANTCKGIERSLSAIFDRPTSDYNKPLLGMSSLDVHKIVGILPGLTKTDSLILKLACERAIETDNTWIEYEYLMKKAEAIGISQQDYAETIDVLGRKQYIKRRSQAVIKVLFHGFEEYARVYVDGYASTVKAVATLFVKKQAAHDSSPISASLSSSLQQPPMLIDHILEYLESKGLIKPSNFLSGRFDTSSVSPELKRLLNDGKEL